jgi:hypothetical protein
MIPNFIVWYKLYDNSFNIIEYNNKDTVVNTSNIGKSGFAPMNQYEFICKNADDKTEENLKAYMNTIIEDRNEILTSKCLKKPFDYFDNSYKMGNGNIFYRTHSNNVKTFMKRFMNSDYQSYDPIQIYEEEYFLKTARCGMMYGLPGTYECLTYDYKFFYPSIMASRDFKISKKRGVITPITKLRKNKYKYGIYHIFIEAGDDKNFRKVFWFSEHDYYTHYSLNFVLYYNKYYGGQIKLTLLSETALIYDESELEEGYNIFNCWYHRLLELRKEFPKNSLIKKLGSTAWGELQSNKTIVKTESEIIEEKLNIGFNFNKDYYIKKIVQKMDGDIYYLVPLKENLYEYQLRLKSFITDFGRVKIAKIALENIDDVVRIQTDSITYKIDEANNINHDIPFFIIDEKKSGKQTIKNMREMKITR